MSSRYSQTRQHGGLVDLNRETMVPQLPIRSQNGSTLAYDPFREQQSLVRKNSISYQKLNRMLERVPEAAEHKDNRWAKFFGNWLGKPKEKPSGGPEKIRISEPRLISSPSRVRQNCRSVEQTSAPKRVSRILPELELPKPPSKAQRIRRQNLGKTHEPLGSHPIGSWLNRMVKQYPAQQILLKTAEENHHHETAVLRESGQYELAPAQVRPLGDITRQIPADIKADRRKGRIFTESNLLKNLYEFPDPDEWCNDSADSDANSDDDSDYDSDDDVDVICWEDAGIDDASDFDDVHDADADATIPNIIITEPDDNESIKDMTQRNRESKRLLNVDDCYKVLWLGQDKELKGFKRFLVPLAYLVAEAENIDVDNVELLEDALKSIIADRERLFELYPLAHMLAEDQQIDVEDFKALPQALENVFKDRDNAKRLVRYHKTTKERLEKRVAEMEHERDQFYQDGEDYIRL